MSSTDKGTAFLKEFRDFVAFLQSLWGILAGISVIFPLSNVLAKVIPLEMWEQGGGFAFFSSEWVTGITTLLTIFIILWTYGQRHKFRDPKRRGRIRRQTWVSFGVGLLSLITYLLVYVLMQSDFHHSVMGWNSDDLRRVLFDVFLLLCYSAFFALVTRAFMLLGMIEFFGQDS